MLLTHKRHSGVRSLSGWTVVTENIGGNGRRKLFFFSVKRILITCVIKLHLLPIVEQLEMLDHWADVGT